MKGSNFELICLKNRAWAHVGGGGAQFFCPKVQEKNGQKMQMNSFFRFLWLCCFARHSCICSKREKKKSAPNEKKVVLRTFCQSPKRMKTIHPKVQMDLLCRSLRLLYLATSVCIWNRRKKKRNAQKEKNSFFAYSKLWKESLKQIHQNSKWAFFAGLLGCCTWQQASASGTEEKRREMRKKTKIPSLHLVNCPKKVWKKFTQNTKSICPSLFPLIYTRPWTKKQHSKFELICWENRAWAHGGGGGARLG